MNIQIGVIVKINHPMDMNLHNKIGIVDRAYDHRTDAVEVEFFKFIIGPYNRGTKRNSIPFHNKLLIPISIESIIKTGKVVKLTPNLFLLVNNKEKLYCRHNIVNNIENDNITIKGYNIGKIYFDTEQLFFVTEII